MPCASKFSSTLPRFVFDYDARDDHDVRFGRVRFGHLECAIARFPCELQTLSQSWTPHSTR
eukprot:3050983-Rhodomonas_salina.3